MGEIDLIMKDKELLVFVEVRYRHDPDYGHGIETITRTKINRIIRTAEFYLQQKNLNNKVFCRFDVIGINAAKKILWLKDAFRVEGR